MTASKMPKIVFTSNSLTPNKRNSTLDLKIKLKPTLKAKNLTDHFFFLLSLLIPPMTITRLLLLTETRKIQFENQLVKKLTFHKFPICLNKTSKRNYRK